MNTEILLDHEPVADGGYLVRALLRITGQAPQSTDRPPLNLAVVLDRSGSMHGDKLERAREAASLLVRRLADEDTVSLVTYDDGVRTLAARAPGSSRQELLHRIDGIDVGGSTNLSGGWLRGRELVAEGVEQDESERTEASAVNRVLLMTDGLANVGITEPEKLRQLFSGAAAGGVSTTTIGFGQDYDERLLRSLADAGRGSTHYIEHPDQAPAVFESEIDGLLALAAQNVAVTVAPAPAVDHATVLHSYPTQQNDDASLRLELGDLYALEPRTLLVEFLLSDDGAAEADVATLTLEGHVLLPDGGVEKRTTTLPIRVTREAAAVVEPEVRREALLLRAARAREEALADRDRGELDRGAGRLRDVARELAAAPFADAEVRDELEDLEDMAARFERQQVSEADAKYMYQRAYSSARSKKEAMMRLMEDRAAEREKPSQK